jgi:sodium-independent sulfate anion transporter 11
LSTFAQDLNDNKLTCTQDRPWNDPGPRRGQQLEVDDHKPTLKAIILDFSSVNNVDLTSVQNLIDVRNQLDRYASPERVEWHFASINNRWTKRALASAGFGYPSVAHSPGDFQRWKPIYSVADIGGFDSAANDAEWQQNREELRRASKSAADIEGAHSNAGSDDVAVQKQRTGKVAVVSGVNRPLFHIDLTNALQSAIHNIEGRSTSEIDDVKTVL